MSWSQLWPQCNVSLLSFLQVTNSFGANLYILDVSCRALFTDPDVATVLHDNHWEKYSGKQILVWQAVM